MATNSRIQPGLGSAQCVRASVASNFTIEPAVTREYDRLVGQSFHLGAFGAGWRLAPLPRASARRQSLSRWHQTGPKTLSGPSRRLTRTLPPSPPTTVGITPADPQNGSALTAAAHGSADPNPGNSISYEYEWSRSRDERDSWCRWGWPGSSLHASETLPGECWKVRARAGDGRAYSDWVESVRSPSSACSPPTCPCWMPSRFRAAFRSA